MTMRDWAGSPEMKVHPNGTIFAGEPDRFGRLVFKPWRCSWLVQVPSGNPEPDFPEDLWKVIECGAKVKDHPEFPDEGWRCEAGHEHVGMEARWRSGKEAEDAWMEREAEARIERNQGPLSRFATW